MRKAVFIQAWTRCKPFNRFDPTFWAMRTTTMQAQCKDKTTSCGNEVQVHNYKSLFQSTGTARNDAFNHRRAKVQLLTYFQVGHWVASRNSVPWCCRTTAIPSAPPRHAWQNLPYRHKIAPAILIHEPVLILYTNTKTNCPKNSSIPSCRGSHMFTYFHTDPFTHRPFYTKKLLHTEAFTHRPFYTQTLLHTEVFTHRSFYAQKFLHTEAFTRRLLYTQTLLHADAFTYRPFYTQTLLHTEAFTHRSFCTQKLLHTEAFTHKHFHTQKLLHTNTFTHRGRTTREIAIFLQFLTFNVHFVRKGRDGPSKIAVFPQFLTSNVHFVRTGCPWHLKIAILLQFLTSNVHFVRKGCDGLTNFTSVFDVQRPFRAKRLPVTPQNRNFSSVFDVQRPFRAKGLRWTN